MFMMDTDFREKKENLNFGFVERKILFLTGNFQSAKIYLC